MRRREGERRDLGEAVHVDGCFVWDGWKEDGFGCVMNWAMAGDGFLGLIPEPLRSQNPKLQIIVNLSRSPMVIRRITAYDRPFLASARLARSHFLWSIFHKTYLPLFFFRISPPPKQVPDFFRRRPRSHVPRFCHVSQSRSPVLPLNPTLILEYCHLYFLRHNAGTPPTASATHLPDPAHSLPPRPLFPFRSGPRLDAHCARFPRLARRLVRRPRPLRIHPPPHI